MTTGSLSKINFGNVVGVIIILLLALMVMGILLNPLFTAPGRDSGIFLYIGSLILKGKLPYVSAWENKGPLVFYINALGLFLSGGSRWGIWLMEFLFLFGAALIGYGTIKRSMGIIPALAGTFFWINAAGNVLEGGNLSEEYSLLFYFLAVWAFLNSFEKPTKRIYTFLIGITLGLNILLRPNNIGIHAALVMAYFLTTLSSKDWRMLFERLILIAAGSLIVILPVVAYFALRAGLSEMFKVVILFNVQYSEESNPASILKGIQVAFDAFTWKYYILSVIGFVASLLSLFKPKALQTSLGKLILALLIGWPIEVILSTLSGRNYLHYFIVWTLYIGFFSGYTVYLIWNWMPRNYKRYLEYAVIAALFLVTILGNINVWKNYGTALALKLSDPNAEMDYRFPIADYIAANTQPSDKVLVWGFRPAIYFMSEREASASFLPYPLIHVDTPLGRQWGEQFYEQFTANPPVLIVDVGNPEVDPIPSINEEVRKTQKKILRNAVLAPNVDKVFDYINANYTLIGEVDGYPVYQLKSPVK